MVMNFIVTTADKEAVLMGAKVVIFYITSDYCLLPQSSCCVELSYHATQWYLRRLFLVGNSFPQEVF